MDTQTPDSRIREHLGVKEALRQRGQMPDYWMVGYRPDEATLEDFTAPEWDPDVILNYVGHAHRLAGTASSVLELVGDTPANRAAVFGAVQALMGEANLYFNRGIGRPDAPLPAFLHPGHHVQGAIKSATTADLLTDELVRDVIAVTLTEFEGSLRTVYVLGFEAGRPDGEPSMGWTTPRERTQLLEHLESSRKTGEGTEHDTLRALWVKHGGDDDGREWSDLWDSFTNAIDTWLPRFESHAAPESAQPRGVEAVTAWLALQGVHNPIDELISMAHKEEDRLRVEIARLEALLGDHTEPTPPTSNDDVLAMARGHMRTYQAVFVTSGLVPGHFDTEAIDVELMGAAQLTGSLMASANPEGSILQFRPYSGQEALWSRTGAHRFGALVAHETTHALQGRIGTLAAGSLACEATAVASEWLWPLLTSAELYSVLGMLKNELRRAVGFRCCLQFHAQRRDDVLAMQTEYQSALECDEEEAERRFNIILVSIGGFSIYWLGPKLVQHFTVAMHEGDLAQAFSWLAHNTGLSMPAHLYIDGFDSSTFRLELPNTPLVVQIARKHFPPRKRGGGIAPGTVN